jgi:hypothetical protein
VIQSTAARAYGLPLNTSQPHQSRKEGKRKSPSPPVLGVCRVSTSGTSWWWMLAAVYRRSFENTTFTRWVPETDKIKPATRQGTQSERSEGAKPYRARRQRDMYKSIWIEVRFRGGPEASWLITARGRTWRYPGHMALHDCLSDALS